MKNLCIQSGGKVDPSAIPPFLLLHCDVNSGCPPPPLASHAGCRRQLDKCSPDDPDTLVNTGCVLFKEGKYEPARQRFNEALSILGYKVCVWGGGGTRCAGSVYAGSLAGEAQTSALTRPPASWGTRCVGAPSRGVRGVRGGGRKV